MPDADYAIRIKGIGKQYRIGKEQSDARFRYKSLRDSLGGILRSPAKSIRALLPSRLDESTSFWALKDIHVDIRRGDVVGIIGRNGAGKSTLLKILSRITRPTTGEIELRGRVGSLLEVGTGFHPELTGRDNIYLNGSVLGMTRAEVKRKFDEIVAFSEIQKFLDTPVKQYSSGMYMRLAFSVAAHLEPEILIVDEVLAVGDAGFQRKCLGKMKTISGEGRTVLFVSHNMSAILSLCTSAVWLKDGAAQETGEVSSVVRKYLAAGAGHIMSRTFDTGPLKRCQINAGAQGFEIQATFETTMPIDLPSLGFVLTDAYGAPLLGDNPRHADIEGLNGSVTSGTITARIEAPGLRDGDYRLSIWFGDRNADFVHYADALYFSVAGQERAQSVDPAIVGPVVPSTRWIFNKAEPRL